MGRPPSSGGPAFRFTQGEVAEMEAYLQHVNNAVPAREAVNSLAEKFSGSSERAGNIIVQPKQVWNWFQNRRYSQRTKVPKTPVKIPLTSAHRDDSTPYTNVINSAPSASGKRAPDSILMEFEAKSIRDGAWYDVACFLSLRKMETGDPEVQVRFGGFGVEEDEWINVRKCVRQRSLPCEPSECAVVLPGDLILCFQEGKEQALYFDAHILDAQRRRHDVRGCRCRFLVRYDHDQSEEIVPLKKICRRPETEYRMQVLFATKAIVRPVVPSTEKDPFGASSGTDLNRSAAHQIRKARKLDVNTDEAVLSPQMKEPQAVEGSVVPSAGISSVTQVVTKGDASNTGGSYEITQQ